MGVEEKRTWIDPGDTRLSIQTQCLLIDLCRSSYYYRPALQEGAENQELMRLVDRLYLKRPYYGSPRMTHWLRRLGHQVNHKRVERLMWLMALQAVVPGPHTSRPHPQHPIYPYLLRGVQINAPDEVWCADITYIPMRRGYQYLVAIMDWFSRYVLAWELSNSLESCFCVEALERALGISVPGIFNTDQGAQFTSREFIERLVTACVRISMDGRGRVMDNIFVERLWRSVKYEEVYLQDYRDGKEAREGLKQYFSFYNIQRPHQGLANLTPAEVYRCRN
jgi:putative transposase